MPAFDAVIRWTFGVSLLVHAAAFGSVWVTMGHHSRAAAPPAPTDVWVGTTVSVVEQSTHTSVPPSPESEKFTERSSSNWSSLAMPVPRKAELLATRASTVGCPTPARQRPLPTSDLHPPATANAGASVDLKRAMLDATNRPSSEPGTFGAAGVDLRERRLPNAFTRALPVAIGADPGWWRHHQGSIGRVQFEVTLDASGKIDEVNVLDEAKHAFLARVVRRVAGLLAVGTFALPPSASSSARQRFELRLDFEEGIPSSITTADPGDLVEKGWEPPSDTGPGKAIIRDALGHTMLAYLKVLSASTSTPE